MTTPTPTPRSARRWRRARAAVLATSDICWICGLPGATEVDHVTPLAHGGHLTARDNLRPAHRRCNARRGAGVAVSATITSRQW